ncbi:MAG: hypothetical protein MI757_14430, partial [Pirellulales bacterium]|nr:hypothetical protein [Pirellulales bacterium]
MARVVSVLVGARFLAALSWVAIPAAVETLVIVEFSKTLGASLIAAMSGMRSSPEQYLLYDLLSVVAAGAQVLLFLGVVGVVTFRKRRPTRAFPAAGFDLRPPGWAIPVLAAWAVVAIIPQRELSRNHRVESLLIAGEYAEVLRFVSDTGIENFAPALRVPPDPYEYEALRHLPKLLEVMDGAESVETRE